MRRHALLTIAVSAALSAMGMAAGAHVETAAAQAAQQTYTDAQLRAYVAASREVEPISGRIAQMSPQERTQATTQIRTILRRHEITGDQYNAIESQARTDETLAQRIAALHVQNLTDDTLRRFVTAAREIDPISRGLPAQPTETQRAEAAAQIRRIRPPEPYKGKGIKYVDEVIRRKAGKTAKSA